MFHRRLWILTAVWLVFRFVFAKESVGLTPQGCKFLEFRPKFLPFFVNYVYKLLETVEIFDSKPEIFAPYALSPTDS